MSSRRTKSPLRSVNAAVGAVSAPVVGTTRRVSALVKSSVSSAPIVHSLTLASQKSGSARSTHYFLTFLVFVGLVVGIALCDKYGRKIMSDSETSSQKTVDTALRRRFGLGLGVGIFVVLLAGHAGLYFLLLIAGFVMGTTSYVKDEMQPWETRVIYRRYYTGVFSGALLAIGSNHIMRHALGIDNK